MPMQMRHQTPTNLLRRMWILIGSHPLMLIKKIQKTKTSNMTKMNPH